MKTLRQSHSGSEGAYPSDDNDEDFVDVESEASDDRQYQEFDVNKFLDNVLTGVGTGEVKRLGKALRNACQERDLVQLVRGVLHLVELYQAGKRSRSRSSLSAVGKRGTRTAPSKNLKKGNQSPPTRTGERCRRHGNEGAVPTLVDIIDLEENAGTSVADPSPSPSNQGPDEMTVVEDDLQDLEPATVKREDELPQNELPSDSVEQEEGGNNDDWDPPTPTVIKVASLQTLHPKTNKDDANGFEEEEENAEGPPVLIPEVPQDPSRFRPPYPEKGRALRGLRKPPQKKKKNSHVTNTGGEDSSSSSESDVFLEQDSLSEGSSRNDQEEALVVARSLKRQKRGLRKPPQKKKKASEDIPIPTNNPDGVDDVFHSRRERRSTKTQKGKKTHKCPVCKKMWQSRAHLESHLRVHSEERPFRCPSPNCGKTFKHKKELTPHLLSHEWAKPFRCHYPRCRRAFDTLVDLDAHKHKLGHNMNLPFSCEHPGCGKSFELKSTLRNHEGIHTKPFKCPFKGCGNGFGTKAALQTHQRKNNHD